MISTAGSRKSWSIWGFLWRKIRNSRESGSPYCWAKLDNKSGATNFKTTEGRNPFSKIKKSSIFLTSRPSAEDGGRGPHSKIFDVVSNGHIYSTLWPRFRRGFLSVTKPNAAQRHQKHQHHITVVPSAVQVLSFFPQTSPQFARLGTLNVLTRAAWHAHYGTLKMIVKIVIVIQELRGRRPLWKERLPGHQVW